jgi:hypothetical protein
MARPRSASSLLVAAILGVALMSVSACGSASTEADSAAAGSTNVEKQALSDYERSGYFERIRDAVLQVAAMDFAQGTGIGGPAYESCVRRLLREALDRPTITTLVQVYRRPGGQQFAAQALNALSSPLGAMCGHRSYVPELVDASRGLREGKPTGAAVRTLGVTYGPFLGVRCRRADHIGCDRVGVDVVLATAATGAVALVGDRRARLRTPGVHNAVRHHDWVGTFSNAGMDRRGSPFHIRGNRRAGAVWAGSPPVYLPIELRVRFADGHSASALFPRVFVSPGWG